MCTLSFFCSLPLCPSYGVCYKVPEPASVYFIFFLFPLPLSQLWSVTKSQTQLVCTLSFFCSLPLCPSHGVCHKVPEPANVYFIFFSVRSPSVPVMECVTKSQSQLVCTLSFFLFPLPLSQFWSVSQSPRAS